MSKPPPSARDPHVLYTRAVQTPDIDVRFLDWLYRKNAGGPAEIFREDFCGTAALSCAWVKLGTARRAIGVDLHGQTLSWGKKHHLSQLTPEQRQRIQLVKANVLDVRRPKADILCAFNFSYSVFKTRAQMQAYASNARRSLAPGGLLVMDAWGGSEVQMVHTERRRLKDGLTYVWEQASFDPITHDIECRIHFEFRDGRRPLRNAFIYDWRLWTLPELQEVMQQAGLEDVHVLWEGTTRSGRGNGVFKRRTRGDADQAWIAYVIGRAPR
jgi:SAM-dependent methyltransferase